MSINGLKIWFYYSSYKYRRFLESSILIFGILYLISPKIREFFIQENSASTQPIYFVNFLGLLPNILLSLFSLAFFVWLIFPAWFDFRFRYLAWWVSQPLGSLLHWLECGWRLWLITIFVVTIADLVLSSPAGTHPSLTNLGSLGFWLTVFAVTALLVVLYWVYQARGRLVVMEFTDYTGDEKLNAWMKGLPPMLLDELGRITNLYRTVDDVSPYQASTATTDSEISINPTLRVEDVSQTLKDAVSSESKISLGPLEIPIGAIMGIAAKTVEGPRLTGSLHAEGDQLVLVASITGGGIGGNWSVSTRDLTEPKLHAGTETLVEMTRQMAYRIFTDLEGIHIGSPRWEAVYHYTQGLRAYRNSLRTKWDKNPQLRNAERAFIRALAEDRQFLQCHYNLGIIYNALGIRESACSSFSKASGKDIGTSNAYLSNVYYAMAQNYSDLNDYESALGLCEKSIIFFSDNARAWDLKGFMLRKSEEKKANTPRFEPGKNPSLWENIIPSREIATVLAWKNLCHFVLKGDGAEKKKYVASGCTRNLAVAYEMDKRPNSIAVFHQAIYLSPQNADLYFELGKTFIEEERWQSAVEILKSAIYIENRPTYWSYLALANKGLLNVTKDSERRKEIEKDLEYSCKNAMVSEPRTKEEIASTLANTINFISKIKNDKETSLILNTIKLIKFRKDYLNNKITLEDYRRDLNGILDNVKNVKWIVDWIDAQVTITGTSEDKEDNIINIYSTIIKNLMENCPLEVKNFGLHKLLSDINLKQKKFSAALYHAQRSVALNPNDSSCRDKLISVYDEYQNFGLARHELEICTSLNPTDADLLMKFAWSNSEFLQGLRGFEKRREALLQFINNLNYSLEIMENTPLSYSDDISKHGFIYYWLGVAHYELIDYDKSIQNLIIAKNLMSGESNDKSHLVIMKNLGEVYLLNKSYDECKKEWDDLAQELKNIVKTKSQLKDKIGSSIGYARSMGCLVASVYIGISFCYAERDVNLDDALRLVEKARLYIEKLDDLKEKSECEALYEDCKGWIIYKQNKLGDVHGSMDKAIIHLKNAASQSAQSEFYLHLAEASEFMIQLAKRGLLEEDNILKDICIVKDSAMIYCRHAEELDISGRYAGRIKELKLRLEKTDD